MTRTALCALILALALGSCAQVERDVRHDLATAAEVAQAFGDTQLVGCLGALQELADVKFGHSVALDIITAAVIVKEGRALFASGGACEDVTADIAVNALAHFALPF